jgi:hypothetical protein
VLILPARQACIDPIASPGALAALREVIRVTTTDHQFDDDRTVLLLAPTFSTEAEEICLDHVTGDPDEDTCTLSVCFREAADDRLSTLEHHAESFDSVAIVDVGTPNGPSGESTCDHSAVKRVSDPADLTGIGMAISQWLDAQHEDAEDLTVCVDSLSTLHQYADHKRAFRFLHTITARLRKAGASAHFHLDPDAHDPQTVARLRQLFDDEHEATDPAAIQQSGGQPVATDGGQPEAERD